MCFVLGGGDVSRDAYGFAVRPQHLQRYREYANIYKARMAYGFSLYYLVEFCGIMPWISLKTLMRLILQEEEEERSERWKDFLERLSGSGIALTDGISEGRTSIREHLEAAIVSGMENVLNETRDRNAIDEILSTKQTSEEERKIHCAQTWARIRPSLSVIELMMSHRVKKKNSEGGDQAAPKSRPNLAPIEESKVLEDSEEEFYDVERSDLVQEVSSGDDGNADSSTSISSQGVPEETKEELECLVRGGLPMALRGEVYFTCSIYFCYYSSFCNINLYLQHCFICSYGKLLLVLEHVGWKDITIVC